MEKNATITYYLVGSLAAGVVEGPGLEPAFSVVVVVAVAAVQLALRHPFYTWGMIVVAETMSASSGHGRCDCREASFLMTFHRGK